MRGALKTTLAAVLLVVGVCGLSPGHATMIGDSVHGTYRFPNFATVSQDGGTQTIVTGTVFNFPGLVSATFSASQITITDLTPGVFSNGSFNGPDFAFLSGAAITGVIEDAASTATFAIGSILSFSANDINVNLAGRALRAMAGKKSSST